MNLDIHVDKPVPRQLRKAPGLAGNVGHENPEKPAEAFSKAGRRVACGRISVLLFAG